MYEEAMKASPERDVAIRVLKIWDSDYPWDVRVEKVGTALRSVGFDVHLVARNSKKQKTEEDVGPFHVHRLARLPVANKISGFPAFFNPRWIVRIAGLVNRLRPNILLVRDLPLAPTAILVGSRFGIPVVLDNAENYPAMMRDLLRAPHALPHNVVVRNPAIAARVERWVLNRVAHVWVVVEEALERLRSLGVPAERITVVSNTPSLRARDELLEAQTVDRADVQRLVYLGLLERPRGLETAIRAIGRARDLGAQWQLTIIGEGRDSDSLRKLVRRLGVEERVDFLGWMENRAALSYLLHCDAGLIPHHAVETWNTTVPNKLFDYMICGLPVVSSDTRPLKRILRETGAGVTFRDRDPVDLVRVLSDLDPGRRRNLGLAGRKAIVERYNWERDGAVAVRTIDNLVSPKATRGLSM